ncbi:MAG TPA: DUF5683 domain-containing protein [Bacteroidales bacterium]|nr:DUF5683 domain-containing protein [Bacteroidales bacterium]
MIAQDTIAHSSVVKKRFVSDPMKATMLAVALPGSGQIYNRKYWKVPVVYAGFGVLGYFINYNSSQYIKFLKGLQDFSDDIPETNSFKEIAFFKDKPAEYYDKQKNYEGYVHYEGYLIRGVDTYKRYRDLSYIGIGAWYLLTILDANVDASLFNYDVSDNLDIAVMPAQVQLPGGYLGAGINVNVRINF